MDVLLARAQTANPTLFTSNAEIRAARTQRTLADRAWYPDLSVAAGPIVQTNAPTGFSATVSLSIPLQRSAKRASEREAAARLGAAEQRHDAAVANLQGALGEALARLDAGRRIEKLLRDQALPQARARVCASMVSTRR